MIKTLEDLLPDFDNNRRIINSGLGKNFSFILQYDKLEKRFDVLIDHEYATIHLNTDVTFEWLEEFINVLNKIEGYNINLEELRWF